MKAFVFVALFSGCVAATIRSPAQSFEQDVSLAGFLRTEFGPCELLHFTSEGFLRLAPVSVMVSDWTQADVKGLANYAGFPDERPIDRRSTFHLQLAWSTSFQAQMVYSKLARYMSEQKMHSISRVDLERVARNVVAQKSKFAGNPALLKPVHVPCAMVKWLSKFPDVFFVPLPRGFVSRLDQLVGESSPARSFEVTDAEKEIFTFGGELDLRAIEELRSVRLALALFEKQVPMLREDVGSWEGNVIDTSLEKRTLNFVCTDEATTHYAFIQDYLENRGKLTHFRLDPDMRFAFRRPKVDLPGQGLLAKLGEWALNALNNRFGVTDHFGVMLIHKKTGQRFVVDSWVEDGGMPPHIATLDDWLSKNETRNVVSIGNKDFDLALERGLLEQSTQSFQQLAFTAALSELDFRAYLEGLIGGVSGDATSFSHAKELTLRPHPTHSRKWQIDWPSGLRH